VGASHSETGDTKSALKTLAPTTNSWRQMYKNTAPRHGSYSRYMPTATQQQTYVSSNCRPVSSQSTRPASAELTRALLTALSEPFWPVPPLQLALPKISVAPHFTSAPASIHRPVERSSASPASRCPVCYSQALRHLVAHKTALFGAYSSTHRLPHSPPACWFTPLADTFV
jgi:hypothetical protein